MITGSALLSKRPRESRRGCDFTGISSRRKRATVMVGTTGFHLLSLFLAETSVRRRDMRPFYPHTALSDRRRVISLSTLVEFSSLIFLQTWTKAILQSSSFTSSRSSYVSREEQRSSKVPAEELVGMHVLAQEERNFYTHAHQ